VLVRLEFFSSRSESFCCKEEIWVCKEDSFSYYLDLELLSSMLDSASFVIFWIRSSFLSLEV